MDGNWNLRVETSQQQGPGSHHMSSGRGHVRHEVGRGPKFRARRSKEEWGCLETTCSHSPCFRICCWWHTRIKAEFLFAYLLQQRYQESRNQSPTSNILVWTIQTKLPIAGRHMRQWNQSSPGQLALPISHRENSGQCPRQPLTATWPDHLEFPKNEVPVSLPQTLEIAGHRKYPIPY